MMKIIIEGNSGEGKTVMANMIELFLQKSGLSPSIETDKKDGTDVIYVTINDFPNKFMQDARKVLS